LALAEFFFNFPVDTIKKSFAQFEPATRKLLEMHTVPLFLHDKNPIIL
jgi:hypothetical protein